MTGRTFDRLDIQVVVWLAGANLAKLSQKILSLIQTADLRISPMALVELQYLYEIRRIVDAEIALSESWTTDPFDGLIVAHARANGMAALITRDELIHEHYANARW